MTEPTLACATGQSCRSCDVGDFCGMCELDACNFGSPSDLECLDPALDPLGEWID